MKSIQFLGASGTVTGSSYLLTTEQGSTALVDLGMFQEEGTHEKNFEPLAFATDKLTAVFLTHAHLDHCGRLPLLVKNNFAGKIYMTEATKAIVEASLVDAANVLKEDKSQPPLYTKEDVMKVLLQIATVPYDQQMIIGDFIATFSDAGHILGSASIVISDKEKPKHTLVFSGDLGNTPEDLIKPTEQIEQGNIVIMESTYGDKIHPHENPSDILQSEIAAIEQSKGVLLIPAFSIERTQELLHRLYHLQKDKKISPDIPIFLDSPLAIQITEIFERFHNLYNEELVKDTMPFSFPNLTPTPSAEESKKILEIPTPKVILAGSGMMSGGRILHHATNYASLPTTRILFTGYQAEGTLGRDILNGAKTVHIDKHPVTINAHIAQIQSLSSHADQPKLLRWLMNIEGVEKVFLTHGEEKIRETLAEKIKQETKIKNIILPEKDDVMEL